MTNPQSYSKSIYATHRLQQKYLHRSDINYSTKQQVVEIITELSDLYGSH